MVTVNNKDIKMKKDTLLSVLLLAILAYLFASSNLYYFTFIAIVSIAVLIYVDGSVSFPISSFVRSESKFDHHLNAGSYSKPLEHLGKSVGESLAWPIKFISWLTNPKKVSEKKES